MSKSVVELSAVGIQPSAVSFFVTMQGNQPCMAWFLVLGHLVAYFVPLIGIPHQTDAAAKRFTGAGDGDSIYGIRLRQNQQRSFYIIFRVI